MDTDLHEILIPECEVYFEPESNLTKRYQDCKKNPTHENFFTVTDLELLPPFWQSEEKKALIRSKWDLTVKIVLNYTSLNRPDRFASSTKPYPYSEYKGNVLASRSGTGMIYSVDAAPSKGPCPCAVCRQDSKSKQPAEVFYKVFVQTSTHVVYDDTEAVCTVCECFYDTDKKRNVKKLYGIDVASMDGKEMFRSDTCKIECVTHEKALWEQLFTMYKKSPTGFVKDEVTNSGIMISHPHGMSKHISVGNILYFEGQTGEMFKTGKPMKFQGEVMCRLPLHPWSRYPKEKQSLTAQCVSSEESSKINDLYNDVLPKIFQMVKDKSASNFDSRQHGEETLQRKGLGLKSSINVTSLPLEMPSKGATLISSNVMEQTTQIQGAIGGLSFGDVINQMSEAHGDPRTSDATEQITKEQGTVGGRLLNGAKEQKAKEECAVGGRPLSDETEQRTKEQGAVGGRPLSDETEQRTKEQGAVGGRPLSDETEQRTKEQAAAGGRPLSDKTEQRTKEQGAAGGRPLSDAANQCPQIHSIVNDFVSSYVSRQTSEIIQGPIVGKPFGDKARQQSEVKGAGLSADKTARKNYIPLSQRIIGPGKKLSERKLAVVQNPKKYINTEVHFKKQLAESSILTPGSTFKLPSDMTFTLPLESEYAVRFHCGNGRWFTLAPGTTFTFGGKEVFLPPETEFYLNQMIDFDVFSEKYLMAYDIPTCGGCSGAAIYHVQFDQELFFPYPTHAGSLAESLFNRSGLSYITIQST